MKKTQHRHIPLVEIEKGFRYRDDENYDLIALADSIVKFGLIHSITVLDTQNLPDASVEMPEGKRYLVLAGGRRFHACSALDSETIPAHIFSGVHLGMSLKEVREASPEQIELRIREIELEENIQRKDFTPLEHNRLVKRTHELKITLHGEGSQNKGTGWGQEDTASMFGISQQGVSEKIALADEAEKDPEVANAMKKSTKEAKKIIAQKKRKKDLKKRTETFKKAIKDDSDEDYYLKIASSFKVQDAFEEIKKIKPETLDLVELDPPWGIPIVDSYEEGFRAQERSKGATLEDFVDISPTDYTKLMKPFLKDCYAAMKPGAWVLLWYGIRDMHDLNRKLLEGAGFNIAAAPGLWVKDLGGGYNPVANYVLTTDYEAFWLAKKGGVHLAQPGASGIFPFKRIGATKKLHPTEKPVELYIEIIARICGIHSRIISPFCGSGNAIWAGHAMQCNVEGWDLSELYQNVFTSRLADVRNAALQKKIPEGMPHVHYSYPSPSEAVLYKKDKWFLNQ